MNMSQILLYIFDIISEEMTENYPDKQEMCLKENNFDGGDVYWQSDMIFGMLTRGRLPTMISQCVIF